MQIVIVILQICKGCRELTGRHRAVEGGKQWRGSLRGPQSYARVLRGGRQLATVRRPGQADYASGVALQRRAQRLGLPWIPDAGGVVVGRCRQTSAIRAERYGSD